MDLQGKMEWIYSNFQAFLHNAFDGLDSRSGILDAAVFPRPDDSALSTIPYERMRLGLDDLAYIYTLEYWIENAPSSQLRYESDALIERVDEMIDDNFSKHTTPTVDGHRWPEARYDKFAP